MKYLYIHVHIVYSLVTMYNNTYVHMYMIYMAGLVSGILIFVIYVHGYVRTCVWMYTHCMYVFVMEIKRTTVFPRLNAEAFFHAASSCGVYSGVVFINLR